MPNITISTPNVTKTYSLDAAEVTRLLDYATARMEDGQSATTAQKEAWIAKRFFLLMRTDLAKYETLKAETTARATVTAIPVNES